MKRRERWADTRSHLWYTYRMINVKGDFIVGVHCLCRIWKSELDEQKMQKV